MNYELAKALKDAGYPQKSAGDRINPKGYLEYSGCWDDSNEDDYITLPTLSELIEACGEGIARLWRVDESYDKGKTKWCATGKNDFLDGLGTTPEEAVANLWLALNKQI